MSTRSATDPAGKVLRAAAFFFSSPGSVYRATHSGTWGDPRQSSVELGRRYLDVVVEATVRVLDDIARTEAAMPDR